MQMRLVPAYDYIPNEIRYQAFTEGEFLNHLYELLNTKKIKKSTVENLFKSIEFVNFDDHSSGRCEWDMVNGNPYNFQLKFDRSMLDGETYPIYSIDDIILHETSHAIATIKYKEDCGHDDRWQEICKDLGYKRIEYEFSALRGYDIQKINNYSNNKKFTLRCTNCRRIIYDSNVFNHGAFSLFLVPYALEGLSFSIAIGKKDFECESECCRTPYIYEFDSKALYDALAKRKEYTEIREAILSEDPSVL